MSVKKSRVTSRKELSELIRIGDDLLNIVEKMTMSDDDEYQKKRNIFIAEYGKWYRQCLPLIKSLIPDKTSRFESLHHTDKRSGTNEYTYTIQDFIHGRYFENRPKSYTDEITAKKLREQKSILEMAMPRMDDFSFDMERFVKINPIRAEPSSSISKQKKLLNTDFTDEHYNRIKAEINSTYKNGFLLASILLSKELIRNLLIDMIRKRFPPTSDEHIDLFFDFNIQAFKSTEELIEVVKVNKNRFDLNPEAIEHLVKSIQAMEPKLKPDSHTFRSISTQKDIIEMEIKEIVNLLNDINEFMKNKSDENWSTII